MASSNMITITAEQCRSKQYMFDEREAYVNYTEQLRDKINKYKLQAK